MRAITKLWLTVVLLVVVLFLAIFGNGILDWFYRTREAQAQTVSAQTKQSSQTTSSTKGSSSTTTTSKKKQGTTQATKKPQVTATPKPAWTIPNRSEFPAAETFDAETVRKIQTKLIEAGYLLPVDGDYSPTTASITKSYQLEHGLKPDGIVGNDTASKMGLTWKNGQMIRYAPNLEEIANSSGKEREIYISNRTNRLVVFRKAWTGVWYIELCVKVKTGDASKGHWTPDGVYSLWQMESYFNGTMSDGIEVSSEIYSWMKTLPGGTPVVIDDRKFSPEVRDHRDYQEEVNG